MSLATQITALATAIGNNIQALTGRVDTLEAAPGGGAGTSRIRDAFGGRIYWYTDLRWISLFDDLYGYIIENASESGGTATDPQYEWELQCYPLRAGQVLNEIAVTGRAADNVEVTDFTIDIAIRVPNPTTLWVTGFNADNQDIVTPVLRDTWMTPSQAGQTPFTGAITTKMRRIYDLGDVVVPSDDYELMIHLKPIGTLTAARYAYLTLMLESTVPS